MQINKGDYILTKAFSGQTFLEVLVKNSFNSTTYIIFKVKLCYFTVLYLTAVIS